MSTIPTGGPLSDAAIEDVMHKPSPKVTRSDEEWHQHLSAAEYHVLREKGTERPFTGTLVDNHADGLYHCAACDARLFKSDAKFESGSGWPSFYEAAAIDAIELHEDRTLGMKRIEVSCATCGSHLGHVFPDGPRPTGQRYCINSVSLKFARE